MMLAINIGFSWQDRKPGLPVPPKPESSLMRLASTAALDLANSQEPGTQNAEDVLQAGCVDCHPLNF